MARKILFVTTDQQRYDALGCNGGAVARTPAIDSLAAAGINFARAHCQNVVCMPSRSTMLTGQYVRTHGVTMNGVPLPADAPSVAQYLHEHAGYRTALIGKAHFEPVLDLQQVFYENRMARLGETGPHRGFEHLELALHGGIGPWHYPAWLRAHRPEVVGAYYPVLLPSFEQNTAGGGDEGRVVSNFEAPAKFAPAALGADQIREINAMAHIKNELIDEALSRVLARVAARGWSDETGILYTSDHGEFQGDFGLLFKGPYHVDALMRLPLIWRPAPAARVAPAGIAAPVGHVDLAPTFCAIAGLPPAPWMQGQALPTSPAAATTQRRERVFTQWSSDINDVEIHLRTLYRDGYLCTVCDPGSLHDGSEGELYDLADDPLQWRNLWNEPGRRALGDDLVADLSAHTPPARAAALRRVAPV
jgi:arylsulfatase A-like enzyme